MGKCIEMGMVDDIVKVLTSRDLPLRDHDQKFGSTQNGRYFMAMELISDFDPFLVEHIAKFDLCSSGHPNYLSSTIYEEMIQLIADEIKIAKYYSIIVDSSSDISHVDQLSFVIRYFQEHCVSIERFIPKTGLKFIEFFIYVKSFLILTEYK